MTIKISVIGAGSGIFSLNMIKDLCLTPRLNNSQICFMDIDEARLEASYTMCQRYSQETGVHLNLTKTSDRKIALEGADFVINTALVGGYKGWKEGWEIGKKHGYRYGGSLHIMHDEAFWINFYQLHMMEEVLLDIQKICPQAWYVMIANPVLAGITYLKRKYPSSKIVGLCHGYGGVYELADVLGLDRSKISYRIPGVNHFVWLNEFTYMGKDAMPLIDKWIKKKSKTFWKTCTYCDKMGKKPIDLYKIYGVFPIGDTANPGGGTWGSWYHTSKSVEKKFNEDPDTWFKWYFDLSMSQVKIVQEGAYDHTRKVTDMIPKEHSNEPMIPLIESLAFDLKKEIIVNILNDKNYVQGVPLDFEVEIPAIVDKDGIHGIKTKPLPKAVLSRMMRDRIAPVEMELEAFRTHRRDYMIDLIMMDPNTKTRKQANDFFDEILNLPYHQKMKDYYK
jgi:alpha-galactosidase